MPDRLTALQHKEQHETISASVPFSSGNGAVLAGWPWCTRPTTHQVPRLGPVPLGIVYMCNSVINQGTCAQWWQRPKPKAKVGWPLSGLKTFLKSGKAGQISGTFSPVEADRQRFENPHLKCYQGCQQGTSQPLGWPIGQAGPSPTGPAEKAKKALKKWEKWPNGQNRASESGKTAEKGRIQ